MLNLGILDVAIGLALTYVLVSTLCSAVREGIEAWTKTRAAYLEFAIRELLHDRAGKGLAKSFFEHPLIFGLYFGKYQPGPELERPGTLQRGGSLPSYVSSEHFALALMDIAVRGPDSDAASGSPALGAPTIEALRASVQNLGNPQVQRTLLLAIDAAQGNLDQARRNLENWYDGAMQRVSGWYKRSTQLVMFWIALFVVSALNINTLTIAETLYRDKTLAAAVVESAKNTQRPLTYEAANAQLKGLKLPIGWSALETVQSRSRTRTAQQPGHKCLQLAQQAAHTGFGLLLTALAAMLGAPFWFDLMNKFVTLRASLKPGPAPSAPSPPPAASPPAVTVTAVAASPVPSPPTIDGCDLPIDDVTDDADLPPAQGGVA